MRRRLDQFITRYRRAVILYNPQAGRMRNGGVQRLAQAAQLLHTSASEVSIIATDGPRSAGKLAAEAVRQGADLIAVAGGDGTISEVAGGLVFSQVPLAILPGGTANVLAHEARIPRDLAAAARRLPEFFPQRVPLGRIETADGDIRHFVLMAGAGFDARIIYELHAALKEKLGKFSYFLGGLRRMGTRLEEVEVEFDSRQRRCTFALVSKVRNYGGDFEIAAEVTLSDPEFELVLFEGQNSWRYLQYLIGVALRRLDRTPGVCFARTPSVKLRSITGKPVHLHADGELIGSLPARISMVPDALTLLLPPPVSNSRKLAKQSG